MKIIGSGESALIDYTTKYGDTINKNISSAVTTTEDNNIVQEEATCLIENYQAQNPLAVVEIPSVVPTDEFLITLGSIESPNKVLHDIVNHNSGNKLEGTK